MKIQYIAHSGFIVESKEKFYAFDLWLSNPVNKKEISDIPKLDYIFLTHDHSDHGFEESVNIARRDNSTFIAIAELAQAAGSRGVLKIEAGNIGGKFMVDDIEIKMVHAQHSSNSAVPVGFVVKIDGVTIYHMGDTGYFSDLRFVAKPQEIDVLMIPIGSRFTMGPEEAAEAVKAIQPKIAIPMHYNTFPQIMQDANLFKSKVESMIPGTKVEILNPGESFETTVDK